MYRYFSIFISAKVQNRKQGIYEIEGDTLKVSIMEHRPGMVAGAFTELSQILTEQKAI